MEGTSIQNRTKAQAALGLYYTKNANSAYEIGDLRTAIFDADRAVSYLTMSGILRREAGEDVVTRLMNDAKISEFGFHALMSEKLIDNIDHLRRESGFDELIRAWHGMVLRHNNAMNNAFKDIRLIGIDHQQNGNVNQIQIDKVLLQECQAKSEEAEVAGDTQYASLLNVAAWLAANPEASMAAGSAVALPLNINMFVGKDNLLPIDMAKASIVFTHL
ncbi:MAG: hypothetical protein M1504_02640 [Candidatus Marsarchaeota archaeon]|nr:hypothetical protein [Candidatus Marsarchaeota archaeon]